MTKRVRYWGGGALGVVVLLAAAFLAFRHWANSNSTGTVQVGKPVVQADATSKQPIAIHTTYFSTVLPADFTVRRETATPNDASILLELLAANHQQQFAVTVGVLPAGGLSTLGDYNLRVTQKADYEPYRPAGMPVEATAFRAISGQPAFTAFWPHGSHYTEIALSSDGAATLADLFATFEQATHSWQWSE